MNGFPSTRHIVRAAARRPSGAIVALALTLAACGGNGVDVSSESTADGGDVSSQPTVDGRDESSEPVVETVVSSEPVVEDIDGSSESVIEGTDASSEPVVDGDVQATEAPAYCDVVRRMAAIDSASPTAIVESFVLNAQYIVALVEDGPDQADEVFSAVIDLAEPVADIDPMTLEPALSLVPFDDPDDPALDDLDAEVRQDVDALIAFLAELNATDPSTGDEIVGIVEAECASVIASTELPAIESEE